MTEFRLLLKSPQELFGPQRPTDALQPQPPSGHTQTVPAASTQPAEPQDKSQLQPMPAARQTPAPVALHSPEGREIAAGVWLRTDLKTREGAPVRVLTIDPARNRIVPLAGRQGEALKPEILTRDSQLLAAINASFFSPTGLIGDLKHGAQQLTDDAQPALDTITDQRYFLAVDKQGRLRSGRGGLKENNPEEFQSFIGGFPALFTAAQVKQLEADIRSGAFARRASYGGAQGEESISRSFVGINAEGHLLLVTTGAGQKRSQGASLTEAARLLKSLGAREAYILDGGGSTSLYVKNTLFDRTDGRRVHSYLAIYPQR